MKIAATYEFGLVFQHFGHTEQFKIYDIEDGEVKDSCVISTNGQGHEALADFLKDRGVNALICGGIGGGAKAALDAAGITIYGGVTGSTDAAVKALLAGTLVWSSEANCSHHDHEHESAGGHDCGGHCAH